VATTALVGGTCVATTNLVEVGAAVALGGTEVGVGTSVSVGAEVGSEVEVGKAVRVAATEVARRLLSAAVAAAS